MKPYTIRKSKKKGLGLFAARDIKKDEHILHNDMTKLKSFSRKEIAENPKLQSNHCNYIGRGTYVIEYSPASYMNHSCEPNCYVKYKTIAISNTYALRDIKKGEELTYDYGANALDQFNRKDWVLECRCGSRNCRKKIPSDFFKQPKKIQRKYYKYLPASIRRKYKKQFKNL